MDGSPHCPGEATVQLGHFRFTVKYIYKQILLSRGLSRVKITSPTGWKVREEGGDTARAVIKRHLVRLHRMPGGQAEVTSQQVAKEDANRLPLSWL